MFKKIFGMFDKSSVSFSSLFSPVNNDREDPDGFSTTAPLHEEHDRARLQRECWLKFDSNPQINTAVRGLMGRLAGMGFEVTSEIHTIQRCVEEIWEDPRNRLYDFMPKYIGRVPVEGELYLMLTCHSDGFIEVDFIDPADIKTGGDDNTGILWHPNKKTMPLFYNIERIDTSSGGSSIERIQVPSVFIARYPDELLAVAQKHKDFAPQKQVFSQSVSPAFKPFKGFRRFILSWNRGFVTRRATGYLRTVIEWINYYEQLKRIEIDHKKACAAYAWEFHIDENRLWKEWEKLSEDQKKAASISSPIKPGQRVITPPGMTLTCKNPNLPSISGQDTDILDMVTSGLNEAQDVTTGASSGTFASIKATRGPMSDRISDECAWFSRFLRHDFWGNIFFLKSKVSDFPEFFVRKEAVEFKKSLTDDTAEIEWALVKRRPEQLIDISFPVSETQDFESACRGVMGVKHGPITETIGVPLSDAAAKLGFRGYGRMRLRSETEKQRYPDLVYTMDAESLQESIEAEPASQFSFRDVYTQMLQLKRVHMFSFSVEDLAAAAHFGYTHKVWVTAGDDKVREGHKNRQGEKVSLYDRFSVQYGSSGPMYPGDESVIGEDRHNCRCIIYFEKG